MVQPEPEQPEDVLAVFPIVLGCLTQVAEQIIQAGIEVYMEPQDGGVLYGPHIIAVWRWRITSLGAASILGYTTLHDALLDAIIYLVRNSNNPQALLLPKR